MNPFFDQKKKKGGSFILFKIEEQEEKEKVQCLKEGEPGLHRKNIISSPPASDTSRGRREEGRKSFSSREKIRERME